VNAKACQVLIHYSKVLLVKLLVSLGFSFLASKNSVGSVNVIATILKRNVGGGGCWGRVFFMVGRWCILTLGLPKSSQFAIAVVNLLSNLAVIKPLEVFQDGLCRRCGL